MKDSQRVEPVISDALEVIRAYLQPGERIEAETAKARVAAALLGTWAKLVQTESARAALGYSIARDLAEDKDQLREYLRVTNPEAALPEPVARKKLPSPKKK